MCAHFGADNSVELEGGAVFRVRVSEAAPAEARRVWVCHATTPAALSCGAWREPVHRAQPSTT